MLELLASAKQSIDIFAPYVNAGDNAPTLQKILDAIRDARSRGVQVRLILSRYATKTSLAKLQACCKWPTNDIRTLDSKSGLNLTNRMVIVDRRVALVTSANWSEAGVAKNREVGVMIDAPDIAKRYGQIFQADWDRGLAAGTVSD